MSRIENETKVEEDRQEALSSPQAKRLKIERDNDMQLVSNGPLGLVSNESDLGAGSSGVDNIGDGVLEEHLRSHVDYATLASDGHLANVDHISSDILFSEHHFHEPGHFSF